MSASASLVVARRAVIADYLELTKPRITLMVMMTALVGYVMGARGPVDLSRLALALVGTGLVAGGASALNMLLERRTDARGTGPSPPAACASPWPSSLASASPSPSWPCSASAPADWPPPSRC